MDEEGGNDPISESAPDENTQKFTPSQMHALLRAGTSGTTRALRQWEPPTVEVIQRALPQYEVMEFIARGGMGAIYKGVQRALGRTVAIKILPPEIVNDEMDYAARFKREAQAMASLSHPNIVAVHEAGEAPEGLLYFVMEFVEGTDVSEMIATQRRLPPAEALRITCAVGAALECAHAHGIIHRDIKPSNVLINEHGEVKVADFGLAKVISTDGSQTQSAVAVGTPNFVAPEAHVPGVVLDARADIYSAGVMLYEMLTGKVPRGRFDPPSGEVPGIDARLDRIIDKAMQSNRDKRYANAAEMREALESVAAPARALSGTKRHRLATAATGVLAVVLVGGGAVWWKRNIETPADANGPQAASKPKQLPNEPRWVPVRFAPGDLALGDITSTSDGVLKVNHGIRLHDFFGKNAAIRGRLKRPADMNNSGISVRGRGPDRIALRIGVHYAWLERETCYYAPPTAIDLKPDEGVDTPVLVQLAAVGDHAYGWIDGRPVPPFLIPGLSESGDISVWSGKAEFSDLEVMILDGIEESEALKFVGVHKDRAEVRMTTPEPTGAPFTNTLGMKFVPVPGTDVLFCIHETRKGDYGAYAAANSGLDDRWKGPSIYRGVLLSESADHPVVWVNLTDARGFCAWLSAKEGRVYRLPSDYEWSCAAGIGGREDAKALPLVRGSRFIPDFAWGTQWPPPKNAGNLGDETLKRLTGQEPVITGYDDGFATTAPVMSFSPNALGIHDLAGNVWEVCPDWFDSQHKYVVGRGSSFDNGNPDAQAAYVAVHVRNPRLPDHRSVNSGFRIVAEKPLAKDAR